MDKLNNRRPNILEEFRFNGTRIFMTAGFDPENRLREVFLKGSKDHTGLGKLFDDTGLIISLLLRHTPIQRIRDYYPYTTEPMVCGNIDLNKESIITVTINKLYELQQKIQRGEISIAHLRRRLLP